MKKLIVITGILMMAYLAVMTLAAPDAQAPASQTQQESGYRIGVSEGRVAVFHNGELYLRTDATAASLPKSDRIRLEQGIEVDSIKELKSLLQDYCT